MFEHDFQNLANSICLDTHLDMKYRLIKLSVRLAKSKIGTLWETDQNFDFLFLESPYKNFMKQHFKIQ